MENLPVYLITTSLDRSRRDVVLVNVRQSLAPESTALRNELPLDEFRDILVRLGCEPNVDRKIEEIRNGHGFSFSPAMTGKDLRKTGLLTR
jgi:hypothetical protein